jgi:predicted nucleotidyltransferase
MKIKKTGKTYKYHKNGNLICKQEKSNIDKRWLKALKHVIKVYTKEFKDEIHSMYVRGSVASGQITDNFSDLDVMIILNKGYGNDIIKLIKDYHINTKNEIVSEYSFVKALELLIAPMDYHPKHRYEMSFMLKHMAICMYGEDLSKNIRKFTKKDFFRVYGHIDHTCEQIKKKRLTVTMFKSIIRSSFYLIHDKVDVFTYDLYPVMELFIKEYPETKRVFTLIMEGAISENKKNIVKKNIKIL